MKDFFNYKKSIIEIASCCCCGKEKQYNALLVEFHEKPVNAMELCTSIDFIFQDIFVIIFTIVQGKRQDAFGPERKYSYQSQCHLLGLRCKQ